jgi:uncharacterized damage-inducible protein DinB
LRRIEDLRRQIVEAVAPLDDEQVNRAVPELRNTTAVLLKHLAGSERFWVVEVAGGRPVHRNRDAEFDLAPVRKTDLLADLERVAAQSREAIEHLTATDLATEVEVKRPSGTLKETKAGALLHAAQHMSYHLGQLRYLVRLIQAG